jgi:hypothetical protein
MKELIKDLENCLIECRNPILSNMDQDCERKTENDIVEVFKSIGLICCQELMDLYLWKTGCTKEFIFDLSEDENEWNHFLLCSYGNYASYMDSRNIMISNKSNDAVYAEDHYMYPFIYCGVYEDPILIDLNPSRETYKALFYYSPEVTLSEDPIMIYDSIESWIKTIIQCYKQQIYHIDSNGFFQYDREREPKLSRKMNPKSVFWKLFD